MPLAKTPDDIVVIEAKLENINVSGDIKKEYTIGYCCGAYILSPDWKIQGLTEVFGDSHDIRYGFDPDKAERVPSHFKTEKFPKIYVLRDSTYIIFARGHTHEEVIEYLYTEEFRNSNVINGITLEDKDDGVMSIVWVDA